MQKGLLPLFPLEVVLLPHTPLPLHIFEERYKEMINHCIAVESEFGVVLARNNGVLRTGCTAAIEKVVERYDDGRLDILTTGMRRFEIQSLDTTSSYFQAEVRYFEDDDFSPVRPEVIRDASRHYQQLQSADATAPEMPDLQHPMLSFLLAQISGDLDFRQMLLQMRCESDRMEMVADHLGALVEREATRKVMKKVAGGNGHGRHLGNPGRPS